MKRLGLLAAVAAVLMAGCTTTRTRCGCGEAGPNESYSVNEGVTRT